MTRRYTLAECELIAYMAAMRGNVARYSAEFEAKHPRDEEGKFTVSVDKKGHATLRKFFGPKKAALIPAMYLNSTGQVHINEKSDYWKDAAASAKKQHESGWMSSDSPDHVINHETAHAIQDKAGNLSRLQNVEFSLYAKKELEGQVSRYAMTHPKEFVAEVFAGLKAGKVYNDDVMKWYKAFYGPKVD